MAKNTPDLTTMLRPGDRKVLDDSPGVSWVPKDPRDLILPYLEEPEEDVDRNSLESRRKKAKEVYDGYGKIIEQCKELEDEIEMQSKNVVVKLNSSNNLRVMEAIRRTFGTDGAEITFEMYQACVKALGEISGQHIPDLNSKDK